MRLKFMLTLVLILVMAGVNHMTAAAQDNTGLKLVSVQALSDLVGPAITTPLLNDAILSPDGSMVALIGIQTKDSDNNICLFVFATKDQNCTPITGKFPGTARLYWSPNGKYIAFTENAFQYLIKSHIWIFDIGAKTITNRTEDGIYGSWLNIKDKPFNLEYVPTWDPASGDLFFFRTKRDPTSGGSSTVPIALYRLSPTGGDPKLVRDLTSDLPEPYPIYDLSYSQLNGTTVISSDGKQMAVMAQTTKHDDPGNGLYILDLSGGPSTKVVTIGTGFTSGLPSWQSSNPMANFEGLSWTKDNRGLVFVAGDPAYSTGLAAMLYHVDIKSSTVTPFLDFSKVATRADFLKIGSDGYSLAHTVPAVAAYLPTQNVVVGLSTSPLGGTPGALAYQLPSNVGDPVRIGDLPAPYGLVAHAISVSTDGTKALMYGYLLTFGQ